MKDVEIANSEPRILAHLFSFLFVGHTSWHPLLYDGRIKIEDIYLRNTQSYHPVLIIIPSNFNHHIVKQIVPDQYTLDLRAGLVHLRGPIAALQSPTQSCGSFNQPNFYGFSFKTLQPTDRQSFGHRGDVQLLEGSQHNSKWNVIQN